jgi:ferrous iron transport protein B
MSGVLFRLFDRAKAFLLRAGTTILAIAIVVWALAYFPHSNALRERYAQERARLYNNDSSGVDRPAALKALAEAEAGAYLRDSYFGRMGHAVEPLFLPLGWDWRISMAAMASFPAREVIVATLGTIYNLGKEVDEKSVMLRESLRKARWPGEQGGQEGPPVFNIPVALSIMVFFALCCQCGATVATIKRETNSWRWAWFAFSYMSVLAYVGALITYQVGLRI